jgi:hypothetical protein
VKIAHLQRRGHQFQLTILGATPAESVQSLDADSLPDALALAFELEHAPFVVPPEGGHWVPVRPRTGRFERGGTAAAAAEAAASAQKLPTRSVPRPPKAPKVERGVEREPEPVAPAGETTRTVDPRRSGPSVYHSVIAAGYHVGYVAVTSVDDAWSIYDPEWREMAIMHPQGGSYKLVLMGAGSSDSLDFMIAKTFVGGLQLVYDLKAAPTIEPPLPAELTPADSSLDVARGPSDSDEEILKADRDHHCILDDEMGLVGYVSPAPTMPGYYSVYSTSRDKVASVGRDGDRFKILFVGQNPEDSLEYMVAKSFRGGLALTFDLEALPTLDPPLPQD